MNSFVYLFWALACPFPAWLGRSNQVIGQWESAGRMVKMSLPGPGLRESEAVVWVWVLAYLFFVSL